MNNYLKFSLILCLSLAFSAVAQKIQYLTPTPLSTKIQQRLQPVKSGSWKVPIITWGGDMATIYAEQQGMLSNSVLKATLFREDNFKKQVERCLAGETPFLRGTLGMINAAAETFKAKGTELVVIYQLTWSVGGDALVVRSGKSLKNAQQVALQLYGPHMDYAANLFKQSGRLKSVQFKWVSELTLPTFNAQQIIDPVSAFQSDTNLDGVMCIIPDALMLSSNGATGTGAEGSVKGAKILVSTKTASRIIADVYAVRKDYYDANKSKVKQFVQVLLKAEEGLRDLKKQPQSAAYRNLLKKSAEYYFGTAQATADAQALLGDCEFVGYNGNVSFFTGQGTLRTFKTLNSEIQQAFISMGLMRGKTTLTHANWDYTQLASGLKYATRKAEKAKFDQSKVATKVEEQISVEPTKWEEEGTLFVVEINFAPNQSSFTAQQYASDFQQALNIAETYRGALIVIEGHSDPLGVLRAEQDGEKKQVINAMQQQAKNLSLQRAQNVRKNFLTYAKNKKINIDESQFVAVGLGIKTPKYNPPKTEAQWKANRRVVFRIKQVEAEMTEFIPLGK